MLEFTGERVVPGLVESALFDEHRARYRFARQFARRLGPDAAILDAGCGTGYGTAEFSDARSVTAFDISAEAVRHARDRYAGQRVRYLQAACESLPFADSSFDLVVAFEVIEHLKRWREMLNEVKRVLKPAGILLVSTPNRAYYAESRASAGPNPFHVREFDRREFSEALDAVFPHVALWTQDHVEGLGFLPFPAPPSGSAGVLDAPDEQDPENAYFFLGACSGMPFAGPEGFAWIPVGGNLLRDREHHIALLSQELEQKTGWLKQMEDAHSTLNREHRKLIEELEEHNTWAAGLNVQLARSGKRIVELQDDLGAANSKAQEQIGALERTLEERLQWARELESQIATGRSELERLNGDNTGLRLAYKERTQADEADKIWLAGECESRTAELDTANHEIARLGAIIAATGASKWMKLGRAVHLGPELPGDGR
jgi:SAM-dependent methyltransferase